MPQSPELWADVFIELLPREEGVMPGWIDDAAVFEDLRTGTDSALISSGVPFCCSPDRSRCVLVREHYPTEQSAVRYSQAASDPKSVKWYDAGHALNDEARHDRALWLEKQIGLGKLN